MEIKDMRQKKALNLSINYSAAHCPADTKTNTHTHTLPQTQIVPSLGFVVSVTISLGFLFW